MDKRFMKRALELANIAAAAGEVPVGAVVVKDGEIIGEAYNTRENARDPLGHAEVYAVKRASETAGDWRLDNCTLYVTLEPCPMCSGLILSSRVGEVVFGAYDMREGALGSALNLPAQLGAKCEVYGGICENECSALLKDFFKQKHSGAEVTNKRK